MKSNLCKIETFFRVKRNIRNDLSSLRITAIFASFSHWMFMTKASAKKIDKTEYKKSNLLRMIGKNI